MQVASGAHTEDIGTCYRLPARFSILESVTQDLLKPQRPAYHPKHVPSYILYFQSSDNVHIIPMEQTEYDGALLGGFLQKVALYIGQSDFKSIRKGFTLRTTPDSDAIMLTLLPEHQKQAELHLMHFLYNIEDGDMVWLHPSEEVCGGGDARV
jgi:hypothetical protein